MSPNDERRISETVTAMCTHGDNVPTNGHTDVPSFITSPTAIRKQLCSTPIAQHHLNTLVLEVVAQYLCLQLILYHMYFVLAKWNC
jgi:hypothetical protein